LFKDCEISRTNSSRVVAVVVNVSQVSVRPTRGREKSCQLCRLGLSLKTLSGKVRNVLEGASGAAGRTLLVDRTGWKDTALSDLLARIRNLCRNNFPRISTASLPQAHPIGDWLTCLFFSCQYSVTDYQINCLVSLLSVPD